MVEQETEDWYRPDGQPRFAMVPVWVMMSAVSSEALRIYSALASFAGKERDCHPGKVSIARRADRSLRFVPKAIRELQAVGAVIVTERPGHTNLYRLPLDAPRDARVFTPRDAQAGAPRDAQAFTPEMHACASEETIEETNRENLSPESGLGGQLVERGGTDLSPIPVNAGSLAKEWWEHPGRRAVTGTKPSAIAALIERALTGGHEPGDILSALDDPKLWTFTDKALDLAISRRRAQIASMTPIEKMLQGVEDRRRAAAAGSAAFDLAPADYCGLCASPIDECECIDDREPVEVGR
jgi:hypothetical protein